MDIIRITCKEEIVKLGDLCIAHGYFDGVHLGHQFLINSCVSKAKEHGLTSTVLTFDKKSTRANFILSTLERKFELFQQLGVEKVVVLTFDYFKTWTANEYIENLVLKLGTKHFVMGEDNKFGYNMQGDYNLLVENYSDKLNVHCTYLHHYSDLKISSSRIRNLIINGCIDEANSLLGYYYKISGKVIDGDKIGREIGYPTANLLIDKGISIPKIGVYATIVKVEGITYKAMTFIGRRLVIDKDSTKVVVETYIFDFNKNIYGLEFEIYFVKYIRDEISFHGLEALTARLKFDKEESESYLVNVRSSMIR